MKGFYLSATDKFLIETISKDGADSLINTLNEKTPDLQCYCFQRINFILAIITLNDETLISRFNEDEFKNVKDKIRNLTFYSKEESDIIFKEINT